MKFTSLPLSWTLSEKIPQETLQINLPFTNSKWIYYSNFKEMPEEYNLLPKTGGNFFLRGLNHEHTSPLKAFQNLFIGREAVLKLNSNHFNKKSLKELVRRGRRNGTTHEIKHSDDAIVLLEDIKKSCSHAKEPQLRFFFADYFGKNERFFVFRNEHSIWGAVVTSINGDNKVHTELLLRREDSPAGVMEALLFDIYQLLSDEKKFQYLSLGEVPFVYNNAKLSLKNKLLIKLGRSLKFIYNYEGLYKFKNKFNPEWHDIYIAETTRIRILTLLGVVIKSNLLKLGLFKLKRILLFRI